VLFVYERIVPHVKLLDLDHRAHANHLVKVPPRDHAGKLRTHGFTLCESFRTQKEAIMGMTATLGHCGAGLVITSFSSSPRFLPPGCSVTTTPSEA